MFLDEAIIEVRTGRGGDGSKSFHREKFMTKGGPDGGDGGRGGHIYFVAANNIHTLYDIHQMFTVKTLSGQPGTGGRTHGKSGSDVVLKVPLGTKLSDAHTGEFIGTLEQEGETFLVAKGGKGGLGNVHFKSSSNKAPEQFTPGEPGLRKKVKLELQLMADCGFVGFPNVGKSSLLNHLSNAKPKVADYAFTTLRPYLGVVHNGEGNSFILADIPGILEGAAEGKGLGNQFLRHIQRSLCLAFVLDISSEQQWNDYQTLLEELKSFEPALMRRKQIILFNKSDLGDYKIDRRFKEIKRPLIKASAISGEGLNKFKWTVLKYLENKSIRDIKEEEGIDIAYPKKQPTKW
jgi:GTP-binding protein